MESENQYAPLIPDGGDGFHTDFRNEQPVQAIVRAISAIDNCAIETVPSFYQYADPDALNRLMETARDSDQEVSVQVTVEDYDVSIDSDGTISIRESEYGSRSENSA